MGPIDFVVGFGRQATELLPHDVPCPCSALGLGVGVFVSIIQAATRRFREQTLTFIPKIVCMFLALLHAALPQLMGKNDSTHPRRDYQLYRNTFK